ncbi:MAG: peroxide stress protein YaaA, partial [Rickettsiales bacterium]
MLILLSPAKKLNLNHNIKSKKVTLPDFFHETKLLINILKQQPVAKLKKLMQISDNIAELNYTRYQSFSLDNDTNLYDAIYSFAGEVYQGLDA